MSQIGWWVGDIYFFEFDCQNPRRPRAQLMSTVNTTRPNGGKFELLERKTESMQLSFASHHSKLQKWLIIREIWHPHHNYIKDMVHVDKITPFEKGIFMHILENFRQNKKLSSN